MSENGEIYTAGKKFYTPAGTDGMDKFHLWNVGRKRKMKINTDKCSMSIYKIQPNPGVGGLDKNPESSNSWAPLMAGLRPCRLSL